MSVELNKITCVNSLTGGNIWEECDFDPALIAGAFLSYGKYFTAAELASGLGAAIELATKAAAIGDKLFPLHGFDDAEDASTARQIQTTGYGNEYESRAKKIKFRFGIFKGIGYQTSVKQHDKKAPALYLYDIKNRMLGWTNAAGDFLPFDLTQFLVEEATILTGANAYSFKVEFGLTTNSQLLSSFAQVNLDSENYALSAVKGMKDVKLVTKVAVTVGGVVKINGEVGRTKENLRTLYGASLAEATGAAVVVKDPNGGLLASGAVTQDGATDSYVVTINNTAWTAAASGAKFTIKLAAMSVLNAAPISLPSTVKIESDVLIVTKP